MKKTRSSGTTISCSSNCLENIGNCFNFIWIKTSRNADWTYLIMKVRQMRANIYINGKDREKRTNERTNDAKIHDWIEYDSRKWRKPVFPARQSAVPAIFRKYRELLSTIFYVNKNENKKISQLRPMKVWKNGAFRHISVFFGWKRKFLKNWTGSYFEHC